MTLEGPGQKRPWPTLTRWARICLKEPPEYNSDELTTIQGSRRVVITRP
jgi:hypothetical protein